MGCGLQRRQVEARPVFRATFGSKQSPVRRPAPDVALGRARLVADHSRAHRDPVRSAVDGERRSPPADETVVPCHRAAPAARVARDLASGRNRIAQRITITKWLSTPHFPYAETVDQTEVVDGAERATRARHVDDGARPRMVDGTDPLRPRPLVTVTRGISIVARPPDEERTFRVDGSIGHDACHADERGQTVPQSIPVNSVGRSRRCMLVRRDQPHEHRRRASSSSGLTPLDDTSP